MGTIKTLNKWANRHTYYPLDIVRIALGLFLFVKGLYFMGNVQMLLELIGPLKGYAGSMLTVHYVAPAHLVGGLLIIFGLYTRWAVLSQLPIIIGAVAINFIGEMNLTNLLVALVVLAACVFFLIYGSGKHSTDYHLKMRT